jgi:tetratricopeptide (TPR) repeat protein
MPKLTPLQWLITAVFLAFYGFAVFALTRDYYVRHPVRASAGAAQPAPTQGVAPVRNPGERADVLFGEGRYAEAIPLYRQVLAANALDWETWNDLGLATHLSGDTPQAIEILRAASAQAPEFQRLWLTLGFVNLQAGDLPAAQESLGRARDLDPEGAIGQEATRLLGVAEASANQ